ncbi:hypothetical protein FRB99_000775 [Tulasnella sp. 403]|nr:hypothetical protein FRB99_000775 [Tulasnella sp. 403]
MSYKERDIPIGDGWLEKGRPVGSVVCVIDVEDDRYHFDTQDKVQRRLYQRHVQMIAIAGTVGTGLFLGSGKAAESVGPSGTLIAYVLIGSVAYSSLCSLGEMTCFAPVSGTFLHYATRWVDPAFGFAAGWNYFLTQVITVPVEVTAAQILLSFWDDNRNRGIAYTAAILLFMCAINLLGVRYFGESEFIFSVLKLMIITGLVLFGLVVDRGGLEYDPHGFRAWKNPGALNAYLAYSDKNTGRFLGLLGVIVQAAFSFQGLEFVAIAASETESPRRNVAKAVQRVFYRILFFYVLGVFITGLIVPSTSSRDLSDTAPATQSPFTTAMQLASVKGLPLVLNAAVFSSAFSAGSSGLFSSSRILHGLALRGQAPKVFAYCSENGLPVVAVAACCLFSLLSFLNVASSSVHIFRWLTDLIAVGGFFTWMAINVTYLRFYTGLKRQGFDRTKLTYFSKLQPYLSIWGIFWTTICIFVHGISVFWDFNVFHFITAYINVAIYILFFVGYKLYKRTKFWRFDEMDFVTNIPSVEETEDPYIPPGTWGGKLLEAIL